MNRPKWHLRAVLLIAAILILLSGCLEFESIEQPSSALPGDVFTVRITATAASTDLGGTQPYFGVCLPRGWTIPGDAFSYTGVCQGTIRYDPNLSREQENLSPAPKGCFWWVGSGDYAETMGGAVSAEVPIQTGLQTGRYSLSYLLAVAPYGGGGGLSDAQGSANHIVEIVNGFTPRELKASVRGNSVVLTWLPPQQSEGLTGYRVYRNGQVIYTGPAETTETLDEDVAGGVVYYSVSAIHAGADEQRTPYEVKAVVFSGGTGEPNDPYRLGMAEQLLWLADSPDLWDKAFLLVHDIDLDPNHGGQSAFTDAVIPVFSGVFDGNDHTISHLTITGTSHLGLFGRLEPSAQILNLNVADVNIAGSGNCVGGLVGFNKGSIAASYSTCLVHGSGSVGGLVGENHGAIVTSCSTGSISGMDGVGGLVGVNAGSIATSCSRGAVSSTGDRAGGLVGRNPGTISKSYSTATVDGVEFVGGLVGDNENGTITMSYSAGAVRGDSLVGGLVGWRGGAVHWCFWDIETSGQSTSAGGFGCTTAELRRAATFVGWGVDPVWTIEEGNDYPRLAWERRLGAIITNAFYSGGSGTAEDPYQIATAADLIWLGETPVHYDHTLA